MTVVGYKVLIWHFYVHILISPFAAELFVYPKVVK